ncbi:MAG: hypothetical protein M3R72_05610 [Bacteroidota bacterium]|nr:hypothetical protein [Bacteroidota bacterium]
MGSGWIECDCDEWLSVAKGNPLDIGAERKYKRGVMECSDAMFSTVALGSIIA